MSADNVFLVGTPFQAISAAIVARHVGGHSRFAVTTNLAESQRQIARSAEILGIGNCEMILGTCRSEARTERLYRESVDYCRMLYLRSHLKREDRLFFGGLTSPAARPLLFSGFGKGRQISCYDDGAASINFLSERRDGRTSIELKRKLWPHWHTLLYPHEIRAASLQYFTLYPGLRGGERDEVVQVEPVLSRDLVRPRPICNEVWVVGGPIVRGGLVTAERWSALLERIEGEASKLGLNTVYLPHRMERVMPGAGDMEVRQPGLPLELHLGVRETWPTAVVSVISSAVLHTCLFFDGAIGVAMLDPEHGCDRAPLTRVQSYASCWLQIPTITENRLEAFLEECVTRKKAVE